MIDEGELMQVLTGFKTVINELVEKVDSLTTQMNEHKATYDERINSLEKTLFEDILNPAKEAMEAAEKDERFGEFEGRYSEKFSPLMDDVKKIEGEDYNLLRNAFDEYDALEEKPDEGEYMDKVFEKVLSQVNEIREKYGAEKIEIKAEADGDVEVKADGKDVTDDVTGDKGGEEKPGETEETEKIEISGSNPETDDPEEIAKLMAEFEKSR